MRDRSGSLGRSPNHTHDFWNQMSLLQRAANLADESSDEITCRCIGGTSVVGDECQDGGSPGKCWCYVSSDFPCKDKVESKTQSGRSYSYAACGKGPDGKCMTAEEAKNAAASPQAAGESGKTAGAQATTAPGQASDGKDPRCGPLCEGKEGCAIPDKDKREPNNPFQNKECFTTYEVQLIMKNEFPEHEGEFDKMQCWTYCEDAKGIFCEAQVWPKPTTAAPYVEESNSSSNSSNGSNMTGIKPLDMQKDNAMFGTSAILVVFCLVAFIALSKKDEKDPKDVSPNPADPSAPAPVNGTVSSGLDSAALVVPAPVAVPDAPPAADPPPAPTAPS